ncbi:hypothetical protein LS684_01480 [Cytobacillus spongiae]|jgi:hypothetical protein|uniref:hypothetical protein n=1 Tax=Cytobacillus spongiae TaxID=2901381 RepID=UPI001F474213|nr:hypothetical protein [Cytobacillus spongiae]UII56204.1 hypothetical protein LS684_01480 [Cytobacillus spongiae]
MMKIRLKFEGLEYRSLDEMANNLLHEANERIIRIDLGEFENDRETRNYAKFRLMHLSRSFDGHIPEEFRSMYNSLWSQLYRLEHQGKYTNPYLSQIMDRIRVRL